MGTQIVNISIDLNIRDVFKTEKKEEIQEINNFYGKYPKSEITNEGLRVLTIETLYSKFLEEIVKEQYKKIIELQNKYI